LIRFVKSIIEYRYLLAILIKQDLRTRYKGSVLGFLWTFINPLVMLLVYSIMFPLILRMNIPNYAMFLFVALLPWNYFSISISSGAGCIVSNANMIKKIYFPRHIIPIAYALSGATNLLFGFCIVIPSLLIFGIGISSNIFYLPCIILLEMALVTGLLLLMSSITVHFRDLQHITSILMMVWVYVTPVLYPVSVLPEKYSKIIMIANPMAPIVVAYRNILFDKTPPDAEWLLISVVETMVIIIIGSLTFQKLQKRFAEVL
jgi:lipopolysaccharide transport system permease protein